MANGKILIITYEFPPAGGVAVQRVLSLAKYLPKLGFDVHVLTAKNPASPVRDPDLLREVPHSVTVYRTPTLEPPFKLRKALWKRFGSASAKPRDRSARRDMRTRTFKGLVSSAAQRVLCPDPEVLWLPFAIRRARQIVKNSNIDTVLVTAPPFSVFLAGNALKRRFPGIKLISDFRDEWRRFYLSEFEFQGNQYARRRAEAIERDAIRLSDLVIAVTRSSLREIQSRYPKESADKFALIPNGYDPDQLAGFTARRREGARVIITYVGTIYRASDPQQYLDALDALPDQIRSQIETRFIGRVADADRPVFESRKSPVRLLGFLPHAEALRQMEETDYLLVVMHNDFMLPAKVFEYLATGKPILALSPLNGEVAGLLRETHSGCCADPADSAAVQAMLVNAYERADNDCRTGRDWEATRRYERPRLAAELAAMIQDRLAGSERGERRAVPFSACGIGSCG